MKILLFNLGTIAFRIHSWGLEGFNALFGQDVVLWGPIPDESFMFRDREIPIIRITQPLTVAELFARLPEGWLPDVVVCETSVLSYVPDIHLCPAKTLLFTRDAWSDTIFNRGLVEQFDFLNHATIDRDLYKDLAVKMLPLSNSAVSVISEGITISDYKSRDIDVIAIATYNSSFYHDRYKTYYALSALNKGDLNVKYVGGIQYSEIFGYYNRSKIVIDWAHTLSNRSYEAAMIGCLLFSHKDNPLIKEFWVPWEEYIPYDYHNLHELARYYAENAEEATRVIANARKKIERAQPGWGQLVYDNVCLAHETPVSVTERISRTASLPAAVLHHRTATPLLFNYEYYTDYPQGWRENYFERIDAAIAAAGSGKTLIPPLVEAARVAHLFGHRELATGYLDRLDEALPGYGWSPYLRARISREEGKPDLALACVKEALSCAEKAPQLLKDHVLPVIEKGSTCDYRRVIDYMWASALQHDNSYQVKALIHLSNELAGDILAEQGRMEETMAHYSEALDCLPVPDCLHSYAPLLTAQKDYKKLLTHTTAVLADSPYDSILILYQAYALIRLRRFREASSVLREHRRVLGDFTGIRKTDLTRKVIRFFLPLMIFGRQPLSILIPELIKQLKKRV